MENGAESSRRMRSPIGEMNLEARVITHRLDPGVVVGVEEALEVQRLTAELADGTPVAVVVDMREVGFAGRQAREAFWSDLDGIEIATALLVRRSISERLAGMFVDRVAPDRPVAIFTEEEAAQAWARRHVGGG